MTFIDTHCHLDAEEFDTDRSEVMARAMSAGCAAIGVPAIDLASSLRVMDLCAQHPGYLYPMIGLHPEEVRDDWQQQLSEIRALFRPGIVAVGEVGLDFYWSREFEQQQLQAFEEQVKWSIELQLPLMIHCRKAQNEMVQLLRPYKDRLPGGVFHCFVGNATEASQLLDFPRFMLGVGGVSTFKNSHLPEVLSAAVPLDRLVLETDAPYMAPTPVRGTRNESANIRHVINRLATAYGVSEEQLGDITTANARNLFGLCG